MGSKGLIVVVTGTGTGVGKTHVAGALLRAWGRTHDVIGYKPIETGVVPPGPHGIGEDSRRLARASTFHVKQGVFRQTFADPISPHLAARREGRKIDVERIDRQAKDLARMADGVVVELAGGLFTPLATGVVNADLARLLGAYRLIVVAPDRLGVLHDVGAALVAAKNKRLRVSGVVLSAPRTSDASTGTNAGEVDRALGARVLGILPRAKLESEATRCAAGQLLQELEITHRLDTRTKRDRLPKRGSGVV
jgi:dethiobiotin synthetase